MSQRDASKPNASKPEKNAFADTYSSIVPYSVPDQYIVMEKKEKEALSLFYEHCFIPYMLNKDYKDEFGELFHLSQNSKNPALKHLVDSLVTKTVIGDIPPEVAQNIIDLIPGTPLERMASVVAFRSSCKGSAQDCRLALKLSNEEQASLRRSLIEKYQLYTTSENEAIDIIQMWPSSWKFSEQESPFVTAIRLDSITLTGVIILKLTSMDATCVVDTTRVVETLFDYIRSVNILKIAEKIFNHRSEKLVFTNKLELVTCVGEYLGRFIFERSLFYSRFTDILGNLKEFSQIVLMCAKTDIGSLNELEDGGTGCSIIRNVSAILYGIVKFTMPENITKVRENSKPKSSDDDINEMINEANASATVLIDLVTELKKMGADIDKRSEVEGKSIISFGQDSFEIYGLMSAKPILNLLFKLQCNPDLRDKLVELQAQVQITRGGKKKGSKGKSQSKCTKTYIKLAKKHIGRDGTSRTIYKNGGLEYLKRKAPDGTFIYVRLRK
jgi:hypothetical protein